MGRGGRALRREPTQEARAAKLSGSGARPASDAVLAQRCLACLATETCRKRSGVVAKPAEREAKRSGRAGSGRRVRPVPPTSPAMVRAAHARGSGLALQHTLPSATAGRSERFAEDCASRGAKLGKQAADTMRFCPRARSASSSSPGPCAQGTFRACKTGGLEPRRSSVENGSLRARGQREGRLTATLCASDRRPGARPVGPRHERRRPRAAHDVHACETVPLGAPRIQ